MKEFGDKIPAEKKAAIESAVAEVKTLHASQNIDGLDAAMEKLNQAWQAASEDMYKAQQENPSQAGPQDQNNNASSGNENTQEAEFEEVK